MKRLIAGFIILLLFSANVVRAEMISIAGAKVNMRSGPGTKYDILWELGRGFPLKVVEKKGPWLKVTDFENDVGWVYRKLTSRSAHLIVKVHKDKKKKVNIRNGPGTKYKVIGQAYYGVVFKTLKRGSGGWVKVRHENGLTGWVQRSLLWGW
jgi:SH3-like domain-containing protein